MQEKTSFDQIYESKEPEQIDVAPLKKGKRILAYLADLFLQFILCFLLFNVATVPLGKAMTGFNEKSAEYVSLSEDVRDILVGSKILFLRYQNVTFDYDDNLAYTYDVWLSYYAVGGADSLDINHPQYGQQEENEVVKTYFVSIKGDESDYLKRFAETDNGAYFVQESAIFTLTEAAYEAVHPYFDPKDQISEEGKKVYAAIRDNVFANLYAQVMFDIGQNDLVYEGMSYNQSMQRINEIEDYQDQLLTYTLLIAYFVSWGLYFVLIPMVGKRRKTLGMFFMRTERIGLANLGLCTRGQAMLFSMYSVFTCFWPCFFLPISYTGFNALFGLTTILVLGIISLIAMIVSIVFVIASAFNRSLEDKLSQTAMLESEELDKIYRARGYIV